MFLITTSRNFIIFRTLFHHHAPWTPHSIHSSPTKTALCTPTIAPQRWPIRQTRTRKRTMKPTTMRSACPPLTRPRHRIDPRNAVMAVAKARSAVRRKTRPHPVASRSGAAWIGAWTTQHLTILLQISLSSSVDRRWAVPSTWWPYIRHRLTRPFRQRPN